jgi:glycosyltransferase involved in cell wall biosynthesis
MSKLGNYDIIYISFSDLRTDGRSRNFIDSFIAQGKKVFTISLAGNNDNSDIISEDSIAVKLKSKRYLCKWREFLCYPLFQRGSFGCHSERSEESTADRLSFLQKLESRNSPSLRGTKGEVSNEYLIARKAKQSDFEEEHPLTQSIVPSQKPFSKVFNSEPFQEGESNNSPLEGRQTKSDGVDAFISIFAADLYSLPAAIKLAKKILKETGIMPQIIYDSREIFSALGPLSGSTIKQRIIAFLEKRFICKVDKFVVSGELDAEYLKSYFQTDKPFFVIKNYPKKQEINKSNYLAEKFNISSDKKILVYQGVLLGGRGIMPMLKAMNQIKDKYAFCMIGSGSKEEDYRKYVLENDLQDSVFFHPEVEYSELLNITASADIGLCLIEPISFSYELALPNKLFEYIACGLPVLVSDLPALRKVVKDENIGEIIPRTLKEEEIIASLTSFEPNYSIYKTTTEQIKNNFFFEGQEEIIRELVK